MNQDPKDLKKSVKEHSHKLAKLGNDLGEIKFSYRVDAKPTKEYWLQRIKDFNEYNKKGLEYYNQVYTMINLVNKKEAQIFLLRISKFRELCAKLSNTMEKIKENPSIIDSKDKQQSLWSREIKNQITKQSNESLRHEVDMNSSFRVFYEKHLK